MAMTPDRSPGRPGALAASPASEVQASYPTIVRRYFSTVIDFWLGFIIVGAVGLLPVTREAVITIRTIVLLLYFLLYEPLLTSKGATLGQLLLGIRVRGAGQPTQRISLPKAYLRYLVKLLLGLVSFFTVPFTPRQRAIHDFAAKSMMIRL